MAAESIVGWGSRPGMPGPAHGQVVDSGQVIHLDHVSGDLLVSIAEAEIRQGDVPVDEVDAFVEVALLAGKPAHKRLRLWAVAGLDETDCPPVGLASEHTGKQFTPQKAGNARKRTTTPSPPPSHHQNLADCGAEFATARCGVHYSPAES